MAEYTSLQDYKDYRQPTSNTLLYMLKEIKNLGNTSGDMHVYQIIDKCPMFDDGYVLMELLDTNTDTSVKFILDADNLGDDVTGRIVFDSDINGRDFGIYGRYHWSKQGIRFRTRTLRVTQDGTITTFYEGEYYTTPNTDGAADIHFNAGYGLLRVDSLFDYMPEQSSLIFKYYSQRLYVLTKTSDTSIDLGNIRYGLVTGGYYNYISYLRDEDALDHLIEGVSEQEDTKYPNRKYYYGNKTFTNNGTLVRDINADFRGTGRISGYTTVNEPYNIKLIFSGSLTGRFNDETEYHSFTELPNLTSNITIGNHYGLLDTNIPIFNNMLSANGYLVTGVTDGALNEGEIEEDSKTGKDGTVARFDRANTYDVFSQLTTIYDVTTVHDELIRWMISLNDPSLIEQFKMYWWPSNPIDTVLTYYWTPLDVATLVDYVTHAYQVRFGGVGARTVDDDRPIRCDRLQIQGFEKMLGQYQFSRKYNDWRDYECFSYRLYLPFYGLVELEPYFVVSKRLEVRYVYYPTNHMIHYMIFVKGNIYKEFDCSIGVDLPLTNTDVVGKANSTFTDIMSLANNTGDAAGSALTGNIGGVVGSITSSIGSVIDLTKKPTIAPWGCINPTSNIGDPLQALLFIEEQKTIAPAKLHELYGYATYYMGELSKLSGYCEFSDVRLTGMGNYSDQEKEQLKAILKGGVIL